MSQTSETVLAGRTTLPCAPVQRNYNCHFNDKMNKQMDIMTGLYYTGSVIPATPAAPAMMYCTAKLSRQSICGC